jgi:hypothetical protein
MGGGQSNQKQSLVIRLTRPLSAGVDGGDHYLHIRQIAVYDKEGRKLALALSPTAPTNPIGAHPGNGPEKTLDGDLTTFYCSNYSNNGRMYGKEDLWLEYMLPLNAEPPSLVRIWNRTDPKCEGRLVGSTLTVRLCDIGGGGGSTLLGEHHVHTAQAEYSIPLPGNFTHQTSY